MASASCHLQGDYLNYTSRSLSLRCGTKLNNCWKSLHVEVHRDYCATRHNLYLRSEPTWVYLRKQKPLLISAFQGSGPNDQFGGGVSKSAEKLKENENSTEAGKITGRSAMSHNLFSKWLAMVRNPFQPAEVMEGNSSTYVGPDISESLGTQIEIHEKGWGRFLKVAWWQFTCLDATLKIFLLTFIPCFAVISVFYGTEVLKELTPLWILGPLIVAFDIKMFQAISRLYVFIFKQAEAAIRSLPSHGKLKEATRAFFVQKFLGLKSLDYKMVIRMKMNDIQGWKEKTIAETFELLWPYYWRTKSFLARSKLV